MAKRKIKIKQIDDHINSLSLQVIDRSRYSKDVKGMVETRRRRKKIGYNNVNAEESYLIVKDQYKVIEIFENVLTKITTEGHRHLGSVIGSNEFSEN